MKILLKIDAWKGHAKMMPKWLTHVSLEVPFGWPSSIKQLTKMPKATEREHKVGKKCIWKYMEKTNSS